MKTKLLLSTLFLFASQPALSSDSGLPTCQKIPKALEAMIDTRCTGITIDGGHIPKIIGSIQQGFMRGTSIICYSIIHQDGTLCRKVCQE